MKVTPKSHPELWAMHERHKKHATVLSAIHLLGFSVKKEHFDRFREEANRSVSYLSEKERDAWAAYCALTHPECKSILSNGTAIGIILGLILTAVLCGFILVGIALSKEPAHLVVIDKDTESGHFHLVVDPQQVVNPSQFTFDASNNLKVNCITGCSASAGFTDNSLFTVGTSTINPIGAYYTSGSAPTIASGNAGRIRMDANSYLLVDCITGCSASAGFSDNTGFTAGTTAISITGGWYSTSPTNCTTGNACAPQLTVDRKLFVQDFQGTSPWVTSATQSGNWTDRIVGNTGVALDVAQGTAAPANALAVGGQFLSPRPTLTAGQQSQLNMDSDGTLLVQVVDPIAAGTNVIGKVGIDQTTPGTTNGVVINNASIAVTGTVTANQGTAAAVTAGWPVTGGQLAETSAAWNSGTSVNSTVRVTTTGYTSVFVFLNQGSTLTGGTVTFEVSDTTAFTNAYPIQCVQINGYTTSSTYNFVVSTNQAFDCDIAGANAFQVRLSTVISGTATVNVGVIPQALPGVPDVSVGGTVTANQGGAPWTVKPDGTVWSLTGTSANVNVTNATIAVTESGAPWTQNLTQVASTTLGTPQTFGTAPSGVVIGTSSDIYAAGTRARSNQTTTAAGVLDVNIVGSLGVTNSVTNGTFASITDGTTKAGVIAGTTALKTDMSSVAGTATVTAAAGVQKVGIVGNANATVDATLGTTAPTNALAATHYPGSQTSAATLGSSKTALTTAVVVKASAGNFYGVVANNGAASVCFVQLINTATSPALGTNALFSYAIPATSSIYISLLYPINFSTGISVGLSTTYNGATACGTAGNAFVQYE